MFVVKAVTLKQQICKFHMQILSTDASRHIYNSQRPVMKVKRSFCAENLLIKFWYMLF